MSPSGTIGCGRSADASGSCSSTSAPWARSSAATCSCSARSCARRRARACASRCRTPRARASARRGPRGASPTASTTRCSWARESYVPCGPNRRARSMARMGHARSRRPRWPPRAKRRSLARCTIGVPLDGCSWSRAVNPRFERRTVSGRREARFRHLRGPDETALEALRERGRGRCARPRRRDLRRRSRRLERHDRPPSGRDRPLPRARPTSSPRSRSQASIGLPVSIRGGGHNVAGHAVCDDGVMIDLSAMRGVRVDPERRRARVEGGAIWRDVDRETQAFGLAVPGGLISDTGVAGLTLSGGIGWLRSRHGLVHRQPRVGRGRDRRRAPRPRRARGRERRPALGAQGRRRQLRRRHGVRVRAASGRARR